MANFPGNCGINLHQKIEGRKRREGANQLIKTFEIIIVSYEICIDQKDPFVGGLPGLPFLPCLRPAEQPAAKENSPIPQHGLSG